VKPLSGCLYAKRSLNIKKTATQDDTNPPHGRVLVFRVAVSLFMPDYTQAVNKALGYLLLIVLSITLVMIVLMFFLRPLEHISQIEIQNPCRKAVDG